MSVQPITISIPQHVLDDLESRLANTRWIDDLGDDGWKYGLSVPYMHELTNYWRTTFDWRACEKRLNAHAHFRVRLRNGLGIHFIHERGRGPAPIPIVLTHGFPDSFVRFEKLLPLFTDPVGHGGEARDSFDVIVPSMPGYAFSDKPRPSDDIFHVGDLWHELMTVHLGYDDVPFFHSFQKPDDPSSDEKKYLDAISKFGQTQGAYALIQGSQPQVAALGLNDSPVALAGWIIEKFRRWSDCNGDVESRFTKDELLANVMLYWTTETINSSFRPYFDVAQAGARTWIAQKLKEWVGSSNVTAGFAMFPKDLSSPPREWAERFFNVQRWTTMPRGGHFAALEEPELLVADIREFFRPLRAEFAAATS